MFSTSQSCPISLNWRCVLYFCHHLGRNFTELNGSPVGVPLGVGVEVVAVGVEVEVVAVGVEVEVEVEVEVGVEVVVEVEIVVVGEDAMYCG